MLTLYNKTYDIAKIEETVNLTDKKVVDLSKSYIVEEKEYGATGNCYIVRRWSNGYVEVGGYVDTATMTRDQHKALLHPVPVKIRNSDASVFISQENATASFVLRGGSLVDKGQVGYLRVKFYNFLTGADAPYDYHELIRWQVSGFEVK